jgi:hypothetical protein
MWWSCSTSTAAPLTHVRLVVELARARLLLLNAAQKFAEVDGACEKRDEAERSQLVAGPAPPSSFTCDSTAEQRTREVVVHLRNHAEQLLRAWQRGACTGSGGRLTQRGSNCGLSDRRAAPHHLRPTSSTSDTLLDSVRSSARSDCAARRPGRLRISFHDPHPDCSVERGAQPPPARLSPHLLRRPLPHRLQHRAQLRGVDVAGAVLVEAAERLAAAVDLLLASGEEHAQSILTKSSLGVIAGMNIEAQTGQGRSTTCRSARPQLAAATLDLPPHDVQCGTVAAGVPSAARLHHPLVSAAFQEQRRYGSKSSTSTARTDDAAND